MNPLFSRPEDIRVLHVDDDEAFLEMAAAHLVRQDDDLEVLTESDPGVALDRLAEQRIDCVVSDYEMPDTDGLEFLRRVRERDEDLPFILFTGRGSEDVAADAIDAGTDAYIKKETNPAQFVVLANRINEQVEQLWALRRAEKMERTYELVARTATDAFWIRDMRTSETLYSEGIERFGYEPGVREDGFEWWAERVHPEDREQSRDLNERQRRGASEGFDTIDAEYGEFSHEYRWRQADGRYVPLVSHGIVRFEDDEPVEMVGAMTAVEDHTNGGD